MDDKPIIIIKKRGKKKPHEAHGGSWKIAYADFVTAMMAFFLMMWLLSVTNEDQKKGTLKGARLGMLFTALQSTQALRRTSPPPARSRPR